MCAFVYCLIKNAVTSSEYVASDDRMINEYLIEKNEEENGLIGCTVSKVAWRD
jgi:hypothetical protein